MSSHKKRGRDLLRDPRSNKGSAFTVEERRALNLHGLLPAAVSSMEDQLIRALESIRRKAYDIERYIFLSALQQRNERLFYRLIFENIEELLPIIYTPTVGQACQEFSHIYRRSHGLYITTEDKGHVAEVLDNWPDKDIKLIVVTDGERILGLGDLGANGMGIPIGKLALYTACAGVPPEQCLPVLIDVGTNNSGLLDDPLYLGLKQNRLQGTEYAALIDEFVMAVQEKYTSVLIQFEDFLTPNAYSLLNKYRDIVLCFNDDIQGTASVAVAGIIASTRVSGVKFSELRIMFLGAGSAATGIADLLHSALCKEGLGSEEAYRRLSLVNSKGLLVKSRDDLQMHNRPYAADMAATDFTGAISTIKPHILIGATGTPGIFTEEIIRLMARLNDRPVIFALSNPTSRAECTAEQAYEWSDGRAVFASGSPFAEVTIDNNTFRPGQSNNAYVFPGIGLGAIASEASKLTDDVFLVAARRLAELVEETDLEAGSLYPPMRSIRDISISIAESIANEVYDSGLSKGPTPDNLSQKINEMMYDPNY
jgi:malate dehydrogenase (oxaloacetate-decarboxylating)(NADP+)